MSFRGLFIIAAVSVPVISDGATLLIDDFSDGAFSLIGQYGTDLDDKDIQVGTMLGGDRYTALSSSGRQIGVTAVLVTGMSEFEFDANTGPAGSGSDQGYFYALYGVPVPFRDFTPYTGFELIVPGVTGNGTVEVSLGATSFAAAIDHSGRVFVPITGAGGSPNPLSSVSQVRLTFTAQSSDFVISVDRFSAVPEPSSFLLVAPSTLIFLRRNRRSEQAVGCNRRSAPSLNSERSAAVHPL